MRIDTDHAGVAMCPAMSAWIDLLHRSPLPRAAFLLQSGYLLLRKPRTLGVRTLALDGEERVLLVRHSYRPGWFLPGGGVHKWETLEEAAIRESREEGSIEIESLDGLFGVYANFNRYRCDHVALFVARNWRTIETRSPEIAETGFFGMDALPAATTEATRRRVDEFLGRNPPSSYW